MIKNVYKEWMSTVIGILFMGLGGLMLWYEKGNVPAFIAVCIGFLSVFSSDDYVKIIKRFFNALVKKV